MDVFSLAQMIVSTAKKIYERIEEVKHFKNRHRRLKNRIDDLMPPIEKLASSEQHVPDHAQTPQGLKLFSKALGGILQLLKRIHDFLGSLDNHRFPDLYKLLYKGRIGRDFDEYSEELDFKTSALLLSLATEKREVDYAYINASRLEDDKADQEEDERDLIGAYHAGPEKIQDDISKLAQGQEEIKKMLEDLKVPPATSSENPSTMSRYQRVEASLQQINPDQLGDKSDFRKGRFGENYSAMYIGERVAVKSFSIGNDKSVTEVLLREANNLLRLNTSYLVRLLGVWTKKDPYLLVFEYMAKGCLREVLDSVDKDGTDMKILPWERRVQMALDGALGLCRMHNTEPSIMHRDVTSDVFLVDNNWKMKISGVGFAATQESIRRSKQRVGETVNYISPERWADVNYEPDECSDIYSYGIVMWEIASGSKPYEGLDGSQIREFVLQKKNKLPLPKACPGEFKKLIDDCRQFDSENRPIAGDIVDRLQKLRSSLEETWC
ncbi:mixed lineage kinase domain-like protein [Patiria miniata]|uniref:Protein kinase domain-containing protein n=1 Tax=Patiria miniata TaxID=46514 RepID=A0A914A9X1_PATMI|nr:mixed lineage kinase domain-like protein [Patiria miniata]XP_038060237.1 mixed lineage kinase domain-like protein [Patiria miniata]